MPRRNPAVNRVRLVAVAGGEVAANGAARCAVAPDRRVVGIREDVKLHVGAAIAGVGQVARADAVACRARPQGDGVGGGGHDAGADHRDAVMPSAPHGGACGVGVEIVVEPVAAVGHGAQRIGPAEPRYQDRRACCRRTNLALAASCGRTNPSAFDRILCRLFF